MEYWTRNAWRYNWMAAEPMRNYAELSRTHKNWILNEFNMVQGRRPDVGDEADMFLIIFTAFIFRLMNDMALYFPPMWDDIEDTPEYPAA